MADDRQIQAHYAHGGLLSDIKSGLLKIGVQPGQVDVETLSAVDEFHIGGRSATKHLLDQMNFGRADTILDVGCGLGGASRFAASTYGAKMIGIDLSEEYVETGRVLNNWVGLTSDIELFVGSAMDMPFQNERFNGAYMLHVGMNIADKSSLFSEVCRVLKRGARFGIYDVMCAGSQPLNFPLPWATNEETSWVRSVDQYVDHLTQAGFEILNTNDRKAFAVTFFDNVQAANAKRGGPPPLGLHTLMRRTTPLKMSNLISAVKEGSVAPFEIIAQKS